MNRAATQQGASLARIAGQRLSVNAVQARNMATRKDGFGAWVGSEMTKDTVWPFLAAAVMTGALVWQITPSMKSEYAKNSQLAKRINGTFKPHHH